MSALTLILFFTLILLVLISGFLSGSETAITAASKPRIISKIKKGSKRANYVLKIINQKNNVISALLLSNNLVNNPSNLDISLFTLDKLLLFLP